MVGAPAVADLDGDGHNEIAATDLDGNAYVWSSTGRRLATMHVDPDYSRDDVAAQDSRNRTKPGFAASPAVADLDGDGSLEVIAAAMDRHVYAWHHDGTAVDGFPVLVVDPAKTQAVDPVTHRVTFTADSGVLDGGELVAAPTVADVNGDNRPEIVIGAQEEYAERPNIGDGASILALIGAAGDTANSRLYVISPDGTRATNPDRSAAHPDDQAYLPGWPVKVAQLLSELLPTIGDGVAMPAAVGDVNSANPGPEIVAASSAGVVNVFDGAGPQRPGLPPPRGPAPRVGRRARRRGPAPVRRRAQQQRRPGGVDRVRRTDRRASCAAGHEGGRRADRRAHPAARQRRPRPPAAERRSAERVGREHRQPPAGLPARHRGPGVLRVAGDRRPRR